MAKDLQSFRYMTFDVVGTLIDFEGGLVTSLQKIGAKAGVEVDGEQALALYRKARTDKDAGLFPDDFLRVYQIIAPTLGLPTGREHGLAIREDVKTWSAFPDSAEAMARLAKRYRLIAMTNAQRWAFEGFSRTLGEPFYASFTTDDTGTEKPDPVFFQKVFAFVESEGHSKDDILHVAQSQYHDIGVSRQLGMTNCWIERRHGREGYGGSIEPSAFTQPDYHFTTLAALADAAEA
ncbi:HAD-IA family hydrolase [Aureimonas ureilytica]|uniref:HAD-IA family hydrolase n=1 Tax=Aureimonas ureilytica TaxID=401562 RepID=UPI0003626DA7|nr:HAD-IA family hydrolase [Aureimonas ureilytica]